MKPSPDDIIDDLERKYHSGELTWNQVKERIIAMFPNDRRTADEYIYMLEEKK